MLRKLFLPFIVLIAMPQSAVHADIQGSGVLKQEVRTVSPFCELAINDVVQADVTVGAELRVEVTGDDNLVSMVRTEVRGQGLFLDVPEHNNFSPKQTLLVRITVPRLTAIAASGASQVYVRGRLLSSLQVESSGAARITVTGVSGPAVNITAKEASTVDLKGQSQSLRAELTGAATVQARAVTTETAYVSADGAAKIDICANKLLEVNLSGASHADCYCKPMQLLSHVSLASSLAMH